MSTEVNIEPDDMIDVLAQAGFVPVTDAAGNNLTTDAVQATMLAGQWEGVRGDDETLTWVRMSDPFHVAVLVTDVHLRPVAEVSLPATGRGLRWLAGMLAAD